MSAPSAWDAPFQVGRMTGEKIKNPNILKPKAFLIKGAEMNV